MKIQLAYASDICDPQKGWVGDTNEIGMAANPLPKLSKKDQTSDHNY